MIGRADIEGSKSNVAMNAWLPQASYPCGNFSDTSSFKFRSRIPLVRTSSELAVRRPGKAPRRSRSQSVPRPARGDPLSPRKQLEQSADSRRVRDWDPPCPALRANPFPEVTDPILPTSLAYIIRTDGRSAQAHAQGFAGDRRALLLIGALALAPTAGCRSRA
ncbi:hypothetical protein L1887_52135 [Cichorium endivia]|nr:hypothetical protein L1887_52135 [Cichorium endivia]